MMRRKRKHFERTRWLVIAMLIAFAILSAFAGATRERAARVAPDMVSP